jgi:hypothetical protein
MLNRSFAVPSNRITVIGNVTRLQYRFATSSVPVAVDARDRGSLARVPLLREVR